MKIVRLELQNYRRHADTQVEFPDGVVAIVGPNGAGKSSLLEAIAFALFGPKAAGTGKDLIRSEDAPPGDAVRVALEVELNGRPVRIVRELRGKAQSPMASLEVDGHVLVQPIAGSSDQATQQVERLLGLDREGFFQTVVARQRDLDRLARLAPGERRKFILDLVGVGAVDEALRRAREQRALLKVQSEEAARHVGDQAALTALVARARNADREAAANVERGALAMAHAATAAEAATANLEAARRAAQERHALEVQAQALATKAEFVRAAADHAAAEAAAAQQATERLPLLRQQVAELAEAPARYVTAQGMVLVRARRRDQQLRLAELTSALTVAQTEAAAIQVPAPIEFAPIILSSESAQSDLARAGRTKAVAAERLAQAERAERALAVLDGKAECPTCLQPVTGEHLEAERKAAAARHTAEMEALAAAQAGEAKARAAADAAKAALLHAQAEARRAETLARHREQAEAKAASLQATLTSLREALPPDPGPEEDLAALRRRALDAQGAQAGLAVAEVAAARLPTLRAALQEAERTAQAAAAELAGLRLRLAADPDARGREQLEAAAQANAAAQAALHEARSRHTTALLAAQAAAHRLQAALAEQERDHAARGRLAALQADLVRWTAVVGAAGGGLLERFREHLVARTAPAINQEASQLLSLFTQGRYTELVLDDSYELHMGDGGRLLPLERFSGGEQDLAHLALRLGISRLLATRSGSAEIRFLALDEVFSSLDAERCEALLGALRGLTGLYGQVLAVTHLERLQESFDSALRVRLDEGSGRAVVTVHQG